MFNSFYIRKGSEVLRAALSAVVLLFAAGAGATDYTWSGTTAVWDTMTNWTPNGTPTASDKVTIPSSATVNPTISTAVTVGELSIENTKTLTIASGGSLTVDNSGGLTGGVTVALSGALTVAASGSVTADTIDCKGALSTAGNITVKEKYEGAGGTFTASGTTAVIKFAGTADLSQTTFTHGNRPVSFEAAGASKLIINSTTGTTFDKLEVSSAVTSFTVEDSDKTLTVDKLELNCGITNIKVPVKATTHIKHEGSSLLTIKKIESGTGTFEDSSSAGATVQDTADVQNVKLTGSGSPLVFVFTKALTVADKFEHSGNGSVTFSEDATIKEIAHTSGGNLTFSKKLTVSDKLTHSGAGTVSVTGDASIKEIAHSGTGALTFAKLEVQDKYADSGSAGTLTVSGAANIKNLTHASSSALTFQSLTVLETLDDTSAMGAVTISDEATIKKLHHKGNCTLTFAKKATVQEEFKDETTSGALSFNGGADFQSDTNEPHFQSMNKLTLRGECKFAGGFKRSGGETDLGKDTATSTDGKLTTVAMNKDVTFEGTGAKFTAIDAKCSVQAGSGACKFGDTVTATGSNYLTVETTGTAKFEKSVADDSNITIKGNAEFLDKNTFMSLNIDNSDIMAPTSVKFKDGGIQKIKNNFGTSASPEVCFKGNSETNRLTIESTNGNKCKVCFEPASSSMLTAGCFQDVTVKNAESVDSGGNKKELDLQQSEARVKDDNFSEPTTVAWFSFKFTWTGAMNKNWDTQTNWKYTTDMTPPNPVLKAPPKKDSISDITIDTQDNGYDLDLENGVGTPVLTDFKLASLTVNAGKRIGLGMCTVETSGKITNNGTIALYGTQRTQVLKSTGTPPNQVTHGNNSTIEYCGNASDAQDVLSVDDMASVPSDAHYKNLKVKMTGGKLTFRNAITATSFDASQNAAVATIELDVSTVTTTGGEQKYNGKVMLKKNLALTASKATFMGELDGNHSLTAENSAALTFSGKVGNSTALTTIMSGTGLTEFDTTDAVKTSGKQTYNGKVELKKDAKIETTGSAQVVFEKEVDGDSNGMEHSLTIGGMAAVEFKGAVGHGTKTLSALTTAGETTIFTDKIKTKGKQEYGGAVTLKCNVKLETQDSAEIEFKSTVDTANTSSDEYWLMIMGRAKPKFSGTVGGTKMLSKLTIIAESTTIGSRMTGTLDIKTSGVQMYAGDVKIEKDVTLTATQGTSDDAAVIFVGKIDGAHSLTIAGTATQIFLDDIGSTTPLSSLTTGSEKTTLYVQNVKTTGTQNYKGDVELQDDVSLSANSSTITFEKKVDGSHSLTIEGAASQTFKGDVGTAQPLASLTTGTGKTEIDADNIKTTGAQAYKGEVELKKDAAITASDEGGTVTVTGKVSGAHKLTVNTKDMQTYEGAVGDATALTEFKATADDSYIVLKGAKYETTSGQTFKAKKGVRLMPSSALTWKAGSTDGIKLDGDTDLYIECVNDSVGVTLEANLTCRNIYFSRGRFNVSAKITTEKDFAVWGAQYNAADPRYDDTTNTRFAFWTDKMPYPPPSATPATPLPAGAYEPKDMSNNPLKGASFGTFNSGAAIEVKGNFYINGADLEPSSTLTLTLPDNASSKPVFNKTNAVTKDQWGTPFAAAFNMKVKNVTATHWVAAAKNGQGVTDSGSNTMWQFDVPEIQEAYTVYDDVVFVKFTKDLENSNGEIKANLAKAAESGAAKKDGGVWYNGGALYFEGKAYSDKECTTEISATTDLQMATGFYLKIADGDKRWNTDATGSMDHNSTHTTDANDSTDRKGRHQSVKVDLSFLEGVFTAADGHTMCKNYGVGKENNAAAAAYTQTADKCAPVLVGVFAGQELHADPDGMAAMATYSGAQKPYDAHNFIEFRYSEPVSIGSDMTLANKTMIAKQLNVKATASLGQITNSSGLTVAGLAAFASGSVQAGKAGSADNAVHSLYRTFKRDTSGTDAFQSHRLRVAIAGYADSVVTVGTKNYYHWEGYIDSATIPGGVITRQSNTDIKDAANNALDHQGTTQHSLPSISVDVSDTGLYGAWDTSPPMLSTFKPDHRAGTGFQNTEAVGYAPTGAPGLHRLEFHFFDNAANPAEWYLKYGWAKTGLQSLYKDFSYGADIFGGARAFDNTEARRTAGGIRYSSIHDKHSSFTLKVAGSSVVVSTTGTVEAGAKSLVFLPHTIPGVIPKPPATAPNLTDKADGLYVSVELTNKTLYLGTVFSVMYNDSGYITDLAGNRMKTTTTPVFTIDRTPPRFDITVAAVKNASGDAAAFKELYVVFNKKLRLGDIPFGNPSSSSPLLPRLGADVVTKMHEHLRFIDSTTFAHKPDLSVTKVREKFSSDKATGLILELNRSLTLEDLKSTFLQCWVPSQTTDPLTGIQNVYVSYIQDDEGNYMQHQSAHAISDFAVNAVQPAYAYDGRYLNAGTVELTDKFEESLAAYDWNEEQAKLGTLVTEQDIFLYAKFNDGNAAPTVGKVRAYFDKVSALSPKSVSETYNEKKSGVADWRIWLPSTNFGQAVPEFPVLSSKNNVIPKSSSLEFEKSSKSHDNVLIFELPYAGATSMSSAGWGSGDQISFLFGLADSGGTPIEICRYPILSGASTPANPSYDTTKKSPLFALRLKNPSDISSADLWSFKLQKQKSQRGGVTILNNVINASAGEKTTLQVDMPTGGRLDVIIMTLDGDIVQYLQHGSAEGGTHYFTWDGTTKSGKPVARGLYFVRVFGSGIDETRKVMVVKE
ncbi:MAG: FlgD immunoglobulin-like domain containing protein [Treponema sp.]